MWFGWPGLAVVWLGLLVAAWVEQPANLTGKKDSWGYPTPANPTEEKRLASWLTWQQLRTALVPIPGVSPAFTPGWPVLGSWIAGVWAGALGWLFPVAGNAHLHSADGHLADALAAFIVVAGISSVLRSVGPPHNPGTRVDTLWPALRRHPGQMLARAMAGAVAGFVLAAALTGLSAKYGPRFGAMVTARAVHHGGLALLHQPAARHISSQHLGLVVSPDWLVGPLLVVGLAVAAIAGPWRHAALDEWRELTETAAAWNPRWESLKFVPAPQLVGHRSVGGAVVDTFDAPPSLGAMAFWPLRQKVIPTVGAGAQLAILETPDIANGAPMPGTRHPHRFDVVVWPAAALPDIGAPATEPEVAQLFAHCAMAWALEPAGYGRPVPLSIERVTTDESPGCAWRSTWAWPAGPSLELVRPLVAGIAKAFRCEVLIDHRRVDEATGAAGSLYFGALGEASTFVSDDVKTLVARLREEDEWTAIWTAVLKQGANPPTLQHGVSDERPLADGTLVERRAFATRIGFEPSEYQGLEGKLSAGTKPLPFVAITGWGKDGERHVQAFAVYRSTNHVPSSPDQLAPAQAAPWVLAGQVNRAFDDVRLARPEIADTKALTLDNAPSHLWRITLELYGGVTASDVRSQSERIRKALRTPWLRVADTPGGCLLYTGALPSQARLRSPAEDRLLLVSLDWERAWQDAGVLGSTGDVPRLTKSGRLAHNKAVEVLDFSLPAGCERAKVRASLGKLGAATGNSFLQVRDSPDGVSSVRLLACEGSPLPDMVSYDFELADQLDAIPFATGVEGEPITFDPVEVPHLLVAGMTGAGKSSLVQTLLYGSAVRGAELWVVDPVKSCADFSFLVDHARAMATNPLEAAAVMKTVYTEVGRRKKLNADYGASSYADLPDDIRYPRIVVMIDEFTSLIGVEPVPKQPFDDEEQEAERQQVIAINQARQEVGIYAGRIAREARSSRVTLLLGTQKLTMKMLDTLPGGSDLKVNLARTLLGKASSGDRMSALRAFDDAPQLEGDIPIGCCPPR